MSRIPETARKGFTLIEMTIAMAIVGSVLAGIFAVISTSNRAFQTTSASTRVDNLVVETLDQITRRLRASKLSTITPVQSPPFSSNRIDFQRSTDFVGGAAVWSPTERIIFQNGQVQWIQNLGLANQTTTVWADNVPTYLQGEVANGADDNANGLIDEGGLCFTFTGTSVVVRLTLRVRSSSGAVLTHTAQEQVFFRNR
jgi:prepilin-type N-terminal cleavage/methylation domain-containing protein